MCQLRKAKTEQTTPRTEGKRRAGLGTGRRHGCLGDRSTNWATRETQPVGVKSFTTCKRQTSSHCAYNCMHDQECLDLNCSRLYRSGDDVTHETWSRNNVKTLFWSVNRLEQSIDRTTHLSNVVVLSQLGSGLCGWGTAWPHPPYLSRRICHLSKVGPDGCGAVTLQWGENKEINCCIKQNYECLTWIMLRS